MQDQTGIKQIINRFAKEGYSVHPGALKALTSIRNVDEIVEKICSSITHPIIRYEDVMNIIDSVSGKTEEIRVLKDVSGNSRCEGNIDDFVQVFNSRYTKIRNILRTRVSGLPVQHVRRMPDGRKVQIVAMVTDIRESSSGHRLIEFEDPTGTITGIAIKGSSAFNQTATLVPDEVVGVSGNLTRDGLFIIEQIVFPDIPANGRENVRKDVGIVFTSDIHFGSREFLQEVWDRFVSWLNLEMQKEKLQELAESIKYILVAGDIVDGVGVYPGQDQDLLIVDVYEQYEKAAEELERLPDRIKIILSPGNHDAVRQAEPQPALPSEIRSLFPHNVEFVGNPCLLDISGLKIEMYHGRSLDDLMTMLPSVDYSKPHLAMFELLRKRHLAPVYGGRSLLAPEKEDYLVIEEVPHVLHAGHVHTFGYGVYRGVLAINSGTWQSQTSYQKKMNLNPMPGYVAVYNPARGIARLKFA